MAISVEVKRRTFKLEIDLGEEIDKNEAEVVQDVALSFMESRACQEDDVPDGVDVADKLHTAALAGGHEHTGNGVGWKLGKVYASWGDALFKDQRNKNQLRELLKECIIKATEGGGSLLYQALKAILCNKYGLVSEIRIERVASVFKLCWDLFKLALMDYAVGIAFQILGNILTRLIKFLQESRFFAILREHGGWECMQQLVSSYYQPEIAHQAMKYLLVSSVSVVIGGVIVYLYLRKK